MGREQQELKIVWTVSKHNSRNDKIDELLSEQLREEIQKVLDKPDYYRLYILLA